MTPIPPTTTTTATPRRLSTDISVITFDEFGDYCPGSSTGFVVTASEAWYIQAVPLDQHTLGFYSGPAGVSIFDVVTYGGDPGEDTEFWFFWLSDDMDTGVRVTASNYHVGEMCS